MKKIFIAALFLGTLLNANMAFGQTETSGRDGVYRASHTKMTELKHTKLKVNFDYQKEQMNGEEWLTASPYFYATDSLVLNAKAMLIHEVALDKGGSKTPLKFDYKNDILKINLDKTYNKNQDYTVYIKYTARPNEVKQRGSSAISDAKGLYFINAQGKEADKPTQIWTQGETESSSAWFPTIDKTNQKTTQEIYMTVPDKYVTLSNGILKESKKEGNNLRTDHWVMEKRHSPYLFFMGVGDYAVVKDKWRNIPVDYYIEKEYEPYAKQIYGNTPEMMEFYSKYLNYDYPWAKYAQISGRDYVSGAMENTTATLHGDAVQQKPGQLVDENSWESTIAHELFHHWFGDLVTAESWSNLTVNESFANYSEYLWFEHKYGKDLADYHLMKDVGNYLHNPNDYSKDLVRFNYADKEDVFDLVTYQKGGGILHMLRNYLGEDAFRQGLTDYLKTNEYGNGEAHQLRLSFEKVSGKDLNWFFNQWYFSNGHPKLSYSYNYEPVKKQVTVTINQSQSPLFQFPLAIDVYDNGKPVRQNVWVDAKANNSFTFPSSKSPDLVNINADGILLSTITDTKTPEQYLLQYQGSKEFYSRYKAVQEAAKSADKNDAALKTLLAGLKDPFFRIRMKALNGLDLSKPNQAKLALAEVEKLASNDPKTLVQGEAIAALAKTKDKKYQSLYEKGITAVSNSVSGNSLAALATVAPEKIAAYADKIDLNNANEGLISTLLPIIVKNKITKQMPAIAETAAFYPFIKMQNPEEGKAAEDAYNWIMGSDSAEATKRLTKVLGLAKSQVGDNPQAKMMIVNMLKAGLNTKMAVLKADPQNAELHKQIEMINNTIEAYSK
ncbi:M1 family peptidase [Elizabethkingia anophelis]|uniref:Aminopeptidase N n=1 Tax=Elizabethkingia anophelis TaxID=1117645 RepID=A0A6I5UZU0_9FLAO|nr:M1 family aminopeptidase [Elizabethkingia anophelis]AKH93355.1 peptidase M1 [Elizabethkingia anophelis FMS-007]MCT3629174.1 M1 family peptidase [Elizabethkingia anophelis]MCT3632979.1 M1 family peptidase [Elizabethkingia anophelis]MCT3692731.1 M1 family peptidase [Elizabethkingia anophelis]MCT3719756.1 M1 family peptidase [Elizabethkingia anophelis]